MSEPHLQVSLLLESRTLTLMLSKLLYQYQADPHVVSDANELLTTLEHSEPDIIFISKESAVKAGIAPMEYISRLRKLFHGPILLISSDDDINHIESFVSAGVTDVFSPSEFEQIESFISNFIAYRNTITDCAKSTVLLVEDSRAMMSMITELFEQNNIEVLSVPTGREALTVLHFEQVDLVVTDFMLEGDMTGLSLIRNIRRTTQWYSLPILAITGYDDPERNKELLRNGVSDLMHKPLDIEIFLIKCQNLILNKRTFQSLLNKQEQIRELSNTDPMTGLYNRFYMTKQTERLLQESLANGKPMHIIHLDCDDFKQINQDLGHSVGDKVLNQLGQFIKGVASRDAIVGRLDGDEFMIILPNTEFDQALQYADMVRESIAQAGFEGTWLTVSVGVSGTNGDDVGFSELYKDADQAVHQGKVNGKNRVNVGKLLQTSLNFI